MYNKPKLVHTLCVFKLKLVHTLCAFKPKAHTLCTNKAFLTSMAACLYFLALKSFGKGSVPHII